MNEAEESKELTNKNKTETGLHHLLQLVRKN
jgi:hypothetical protein